MNGTTKRTLGVLLLGVLAWLMGIGVSGTLGEMLAGVGAFTAAFAVIVLAVELIRSPERD